MKKPFVELTNLYIDDRGSVYCALDNIGEQTPTEHPSFKVQRTYVVHNWEKGRIRAWHGHKEGWTGLHVIHGAAKIVAIPIASEGEQMCSRKSVVLSDKSPGIFWVPPGWYNGHMSLEDNTKILVYSTHTFEEVKKDDVRQDLTDADVSFYFEVRNR
jgi:dTDP-4-dehydrorhamnose 3,5-epimerase-like enzyme